MPGSEVEYQFREGRVWIQKIEGNKDKRRQQIQSIVAETAGSATNAKISTDEILGMTRGKD